MPFNEAVVRSNLAKILSLIEDDLELVKEEYYLKNHAGTNGFIDILAKDRAGNLVVIEVKISKQAERDAITELFKYTALLKQTFSIKDSEIRLIVISTDWRELLVPFSEFTWNTNYNSSGYLAKVDINGLPKSIKPIQLLPPNSDRKIIPRHWIQCYQDASKRDIAAKDYAKEIINRGIENFVILSLTYEYPHHKVIGYGFYFAQQEENLKFHKKILRNINPERYSEVCDYTEDFSEDEDILNEFADATIENIQVAAYEKQISNPEKIKGYLENKNWEITSIARYGSFQRDIRLSDAQIIDEICGFSGGSYTWFNATCKSENKSHLGEISSRYSNCLYNNDSWRVFIRDAIDYFKTKPSDAILHLSIFNPENILESISYYKRTEDQAYLPKFTLIIETPSSNRLDIFYGKICLVSQPLLKIEELSQKHFNSPLSHALLFQHLHLISGINSEIMSDLGLTPKVGYVCSENGEETHSGSNPRFRGRQVLFDDQQLEDLTVWIAKNEVFAENIATEYLSFMPPIF
jgi:hypothetical protein